MGATDPSSSKSVLFRAPAETLRQFDARCQAQGITRTEALNQLVGQALERDQVGIEQSIAGIGSQHADESGEAEKPRNVHFRLRPHEAAAAERIARDYGGLARFAASLVRAALKSDAALVSDTEIAELSESTSQIRRIGVNLNQIAHRLNVDARASLRASEMDAIRAACQSIKRQGGLVDQIIQRSKRRVQHGRR